MEPWTPAIAVHALAAGYSLVLGVVQLLRPKGGRAHRIIGLGWVAAMYAVVATSFWIRSLTGGFSWLHGLSLFTAATVGIGLWAARTRRIPAHRGFMAGSYFGVVGAFVGVIAAPERRIPQLAATDLPLLLLWAAAIAAAVAFTVGGALRLGPPAPRPPGRQGAPRAPRTPARDPGRATGRRAPAAPRRG